jgi:predicted Ser/Thr protein kinase
MKEDAIPDEATAEDPIEGLDPRELMREAVGEKKTDPQRIAEEERALRAEVARHLEDLELLELLGRGGMGFVWRARQRKLDREVALKVLDPAFGEKPDFPDFAERFAREARALARLNHPNIVTVFDYGQEGSFCYLIMELVDGTNLREVIRDGKLEPAEALALIPGICDALEYAHGEGVVHRDIKPENILLDREGRVKIADFGLAKLVGTPAALVGLTGSRQVLGTLRYMAPEQLDRPLEVDHRADIYSLGVVFYEMLTGEIPMGRFDPPSMRSGATPRLDGIVMRTLEKEPERRYQRAGEVKTDVTAIGADAAAVSRGADPRRGPSSSSAAAGGAAAGDSRLSQLAVASAILFGLSLLLLLLVSSFVWLFAPHGGSGPGIPAVHGEGEVSEEVAIGGVAWVVLPLIGLPFLLLTLVSCAMGWFALDGIRRRWPHLRGVGAAVFAAWGLPCVLLDAVMIVFVYSPFPLDAHPTPVPGWFLAVEVVFCLAMNCAGMIWYRKGFLKRRARLERS